MGLSKNCIFHVVKKYFYWNFFENVSSINFYKNFFYHVKYMVFWQQMCCFTFALISSTTQNLYFLDIRKKSNVNKLSNHTCCMNKTICGKFKYYTWVFPQKQFCPDLRYLWAKIKNTFFVKKLHVWCCKKIFLLKCFWKCFKHKFLQKRFFST